MDITIFILRIAIGIIFMAHGLQKAFGMFGGPGIEGFAKFLVGLGFNPGVMWAYFAAYLEVIGGLCLILGLFTRAFALLLFILMLVAATKVHLGKGFFVAKGGFEFNFLIACVCLALAILGGGKFSLWKQY